MKNVYTITIALFFSFYSFGQTLSVGLAFGAPQNEFKENTDATGFGMDLAFAIPFQKGFPLSFGLDFNYLVYGSNSQREILSADIVANGTLIDRIEIPLRIVNTNSIFGTHALVRAQAPLEIVQPYIEGLVGFRYISTNTKILDESPDGRYSDDDDNIIVRKTVLDDWLFSYGYGGGFMINVAPKFFIDLRADFFKGQRAQYYDGEDTEAWDVQFSGSEADYLDGSINKGDFDLAAQPRESTTDLLVIKVGIALKF